ncbi:MAG: hypothetical protein A2283_18865 [Lentisphaerae bacterium RIFOXYA12_FULL_48_11]|nr:MAG: hypothetical protein A2283_18865 [Lentisphaerae bacterium RIFOXYA12_FULL_48_11]
MNLLYNFEEAYLHIKGMPCEWQLHLKPKPYSLSRMRGKGWKPESPDFRIIPNSNDKLDPAVETFLSDIPDNFKAIIAPFPSHQWMLLRLLYEGKACVELAQANPILVYCIANNAEFRTKPEDRITIMAKLCLKKQKELLEWLGFPCTPATVRLLQKILPEAVNPSILRMFRTAIKTTEFSKTLGHMNHINAGVMALITNKNIADFITPKLLLEISEHQEERINSPESDLLFETCSMFETIRAQHRIKKPIFESIAGIQAIHDEILPQYNEAITLPVIPRRKRSKGEKVKHPSQFENIPMPETDDIIPIRSPREFYREGQNMHHCVTTYLNEVQNGRMYIYRVLKPERATLALRPKVNGSWRISQIRGVCNKEVEEPTLQVVKEWLNNVNRERRKEQHGDNQQ